MLIPDRLPSVERDTWQKCPWLCWKRIWTDLGASRDPWSGSELIKEWEELCLASNFLLVRCCGAENELRAQMPRQKRKKIELLKQKVSYGAAEVGAGERDRSVRQVDVGKMSKL